MENLKKIFLYPLEKAATDLFGHSLPVGLSVSNALGLCSPKIKVSY